MWVVGSLGLDVDCGRGRYWALMQGLWDGLPPNMVVNETKCYFFFYQSRVFIEKVILVIAYILFH